MSASPLIQNSNLVPPVARRQASEVTLHGHTLHDDFGWLRDKESPEVIEYLNSENAYTAAMMSGTEQLQASLYAEMLSHIRETDETVPYPDHGFLYFTRTLEGAQYPLHCRRPDVPGSPEQVLLDVNQLAEGQSFMAVGDMEVSPDGNLLAYTTDNTGFRQYTLKLRNLLTDLDLPGSFARVGSLAWSADSRTLFFTTEDEQTKRHDKLFRLAADPDTGLATQPPFLVLEEPDERFNLGVGTTRDRAFIMVESGSHTTNEWRFLPAGQPTSAPALLAARIDDQEYYPDHRFGTFFIRTNDLAKHFRLVLAAVSTPDRSNWHEIYRGEVPLEDFDLFATFLVLTERRAGLPTLTIHPLSPEPSLGQPRTITFPEPAYNASAQNNREFDSTRFRYSYTSLVSPPSVYEYNVESGQTTLLKQFEIPGGFDPEIYKSERLWIAAPDGVEVPVSLVYRLPDAATGNRTLTARPLYVYGYGSYGFSLPIGFNPARLALLDRGFIMAYAHIRGGGELGDAWHDAGKMAVKMNTFTDFIAVTESLVQRGFGAADQVIIEGGSAGGLLMGAVVNLAHASGKPGLFRVVLSHVPFVDVMNTMLDASLPLTVAEYEEWGNPTLPADFATMLQYSPYDNLREGAYPAMLVKTSLHDSQVMYWEPAKYVAKLRTLKRNPETPLLFHINMEAGHGGASGRYDYLKEIAFDYAFMLRELAGPNDASI